MGLLESRHWIVRSDIPRNTEQDIANATANNCVSILGWPDSQIINYRTSQNPPLDPPLLDGFVMSEFYEPQEESVQPKRRRRIKLTNADTVLLNTYSTDEVKGWLEINRHTTFGMEVPPEPGDQYILLITNKSGSGKTINFSSEFLVNHEPLLAILPANIPNNFGGYLEFIAVPNGKMLLVKLVSRGVL